MNIIIFKSHLLRQVKLLIFNKVVTIAHGFEESNKIAILLKIITEVMVSKWSKDIFPIPGVLINRD